MSGAHWHMALEALSEGAALPFARSYCSSYQEYVSDALLKVAGSPLTMPDTKPPVRQTSLASERLQRTDRP